MNRQEYRNFSYVFIPFSLKSRECFNGFVRDIEGSGCWKTVREKLTYMFRFVADKLTCTDPEDRRVVHFILDEKDPGARAMELANRRFTTVPLAYRGERTAFPFLIRDVQLFAFSTGVCILAVRICFDSSDPFYVAAAQYYLKKVSGRIVLTEDPEEKTSILELSKRTMAGLMEKYGMDFFFYANEDTERANFLTFLEVPPQDSYARELFFLKWAYHDQFHYCEEADAAAMENYMASDDVQWGITSSAAVCLTCPERGRGDFLRGIFVKNFKEQYLFIYAFLLHQKYVMYMFLTRIGVGMKNDRAVLERYKKELYEFETDFIFSHVTEVPQYQRLYERIERAFGLKAMFNDVHEPIRSLAEMRDRAAEEEQNEYDNRMNQALNTLSWLTVVSALLDIVGVADGVEKLLGENATLWIQGVGFAMVAGISLNFAVRMFKNRKK